jgi:Short C-terminal domain
MNITDELERLSKLHKDGALSDEEFAQAKSKLLVSREERPPSEPDRTLGEAANRYVSFQMVMAVIGIIIFLSFFFGVFLPAFQRSRPPTIQFQPSR